MRCLNLLILAVTGCRLLAPGTLAAVTTLVTNPTRPETEFFESKIRPVLVQQCYSCHSLEAEKIKGGLLLDSQEGIWKGGESGPAIVAGNPEKSRLIQAIHWQDKDLQMPPKEKLSAEQIKDFEEWVRMGAPDPRKQKSRNTRVSTNFWSFRPPQAAGLPKIKNKKWPKQNLDYFVLARLEEKKLSPVKPAESTALLRRLSFDLTGLPPSPEDVRAFQADSSAEAVIKVVDRLLASERFGERWGRHWLDVARYADSNGLENNLPYPNAWRYRDYVIKAFNQDKPFDQFIREQLAGDLLQTESETNRHEHLIATGFLMLGPKNLNEPEREKRLMDVIDEQIDATSKAFLGITAACARCHDHKFDPIPTRDYYALAGIFKSCSTLSEAGPGRFPFGGWTERPLGDPKLAKQLEEYEQKLNQMQGDLQSARQMRATLPGGIDSKLLPGIVLDNTAAELKGEWKTSMYSTNFVDQNYIQDGDEGKGRKTARFVPTFKKAGFYEVRIAYTPRLNRATNVPVTITSREGTNTVYLNQRLEPLYDKAFASIGTFDFALGTNGTVTIGNQGTKGFVVVDAVQFLPADAMEMSMMMASPKAVGRPVKYLNEEEQEELSGKISELQQKAPPPMPSAMAIAEGQPQNTKIHLRGDYQKLGEDVPRGPLTALGRVSTFQIKEHQSGRLELAEWIANPENPLTARVFVNRVWAHLFGRGLVATPDNFGALGEVPTNQDLLDYLAVEFVRNGWSVKQLIKQIVLSSTYQLSTEISPADQARDPDNLWLWRMNRRRLEAEALRDAFLAVNGSLDLTASGPASTNLVPNPRMVLESTDFASKRRSVYLPVIRNDVPDMFQVFDAPDPHTVTGRRHTTTAATQALFMLNSPFMLSESRIWAKKLLEDKKTDEARVSEVYERAFSRSPRPEEKQKSLNFLQKYGSALGDKTQKETLIWQGFCQAILASAEFRYLN